MLVKTRSNVYLAQVNYRYGDNVFMPYSVGSMQAYCQTVPEIQSNFRFHDPLFLRDDPGQVARIMVRPAVLGLSCYMWNWEYNKLLAQAVRAYHPECLIIMGGIHVPEPAEGLITLGRSGDSRGFFREHPYVDIAVHGEGEVTFSAVLLESLSAKPDYTGITGLSIRVAGNRTLKTAAPVRLDEQGLSRLPSPYLSGVFDPLLRVFSFLWNASHETNRGCPYPCTFCAWGPAYQQKLYKFSEERILEEFEWFGRHHIEYLFNCDANWGILERDLDLTVKLAEVKARHGYPKKFRMCTAKNSNDRVFDITQVLDASGMNKGATLSFQSMDEHVLENVKRRNMKINDFKDFMRRYREAGIVTYTELIMGLPGETYESFKLGIDKILDAGQHSGLNSYVGLMLPNDEMSNPAYIAKFGIRSVRMPILLGHSTPGSDPIQEYQDVVVATNSLLEEDWQRTFLFSWAIQCFHCLGLTQNIAKYFSKQFGVKYGDFYEYLIEYFSSRDQSLIGRQILLTSQSVSGAVHGGRLDMVLPKFGNIYWPLEEAAFLNFIVEKESFYREIGDFVRAFSQSSALIIDDVLFDDLISYQSGLMVDPFNAALVIDLQHDLRGYFSAFNDVNAKLTPDRTRLAVKANFAYAGDLETYAREVIWYGRKGGKFQHTDVSVIPTTA